MSGHYHAVVWLDHREARVIHFARDDAETLLVHPVDPPRRLHVKAGSPSGTHIRGMPGFYHDVAASLADAGAVLVLGPSTAKIEFIAHLARHAPQMIERLSGVERMDKASDGEILDVARRHFAHADRMRPQIA